LPQPPQSAALVCVSTHAPPQFVSDGSHVAPHAPRLQTCPLGHATPQPPQFAGSLCGSTHVPLHVSCVSVQLVELSCVAPPHPAATSSEIASATRIAESARRELTGTSP
jgi:hypothetical protein